MVFMDSKGIDTTQKKRGKSILAFLDEYIVLDVETTGLDPKKHEIIEIAALKFSKDRLVAEFASLVKPSDAIDPLITEITGITDAMVSDSPDIRQVLPELLCFLGDYVIVAHNAEFDINFLHESCVLHTEKPFYNNYIDTLKISKLLFKNLRHRLVDLSNYFGIQAGCFHRAKEDCMVTRQVYEAMKKYCQANNIDLAAFKAVTFPERIDLKALTPVKVDADPNHFLYGKRVCITGELTKYQRTEALQLVANYGGIPVDSVTTKTDILVVGNQQGTFAFKSGKSGKEKKAEELIAKGYAILILSESAFYNIISAADTLRG